DGGEIAEHVLADRVVGRVRLIVRLLAVNDAGAVGRLAVQVVEAKRLLLALLVIRARGEFHVDRGARDEILVVARREGEAVADLLADEHLGSLNGDATALVAVIEDVGAVIRQHTGEGRRSQEADSQNRAKTASEAGQLHPQPPPTPPVAPRAPSRD